MRPVECGGLGTRICGTKITALQQRGSGEGEEVRGRTVRCDVQQESKLCRHDAQNSSHLPRGA